LLVLRQAIAAACSGGTFSYNGAMVVALTEIVPLHVRTSGFAVAYSFATATFGGFTPAVVTYLIHATDNRAVAGLWLMFAAACGLVATLFAYRKGAAVTQAAETSISVPIR
jgi:MHS family citrate/tricarballylate:H+ symporter-like MFS transporter